MRKKMIVDWLRELDARLNEDRKYLKSEIDDEHNRISVLAPRVDALSDNVKKLAGMDRDKLIDAMRLEERVGSIIHVLIRAGVIEEAVNGSDLFQIVNTVDRLQRDPLYKINKVVTRG